MLSIKGFAFATERSEAGRSFRRAPLTGRGSLFALRRKTYQQMFAQGERASGPSRTADCT
jgi:hypothetical protein